MTNVLTLHQVYVEGADDVAVPSRWFPRLQFRAMNGKEAVRSRVEQEVGSFGLLDRDFAAEADVEASRGPGSRLAIMRRYAIENYLLEPDIIAAAANTLASGVVDLSARQNHEQIRASILAWARELALYAAANSIISSWREAIQNDRELGFLRYFGPLPPLPRREVVASLQRRLAALPDATAIEQILDTRYQEVMRSIVEWDGAHQWIHGKVLLEDYLYPRAFGNLGLSQARLCDSLIEAGQERIPAELRDLAKYWELGCEQTKKSQRQE
jgi:hypothetical protein